MPPSTTVHDSLDLFRASISSFSPPVLLSAASEPSPTLPLAAYISFPQSSSSPINIPKDAPTRYTSKAESRDEFYNLGQLWLAWMERESGVREYLIKGQAAGVGYVSVADRRGVVEYLSGEGEGAGRVMRRGEDAAIAPASTAASTTVESLPLALDSAAEAGPSRQSAPAKRKYEVDVADREFCRKLRAEEVELQDRNSVLRTSGGGKVNNFQPFLQNVMIEKIRALRKSLETSGNRAAPAPTQASLDPSRGARKAKSSNPIIMISSSPTSLITMWNVKKFLEQGLFEPSEIARQNEASQGNVRAEDMVPIMRKRVGPGGDVTSKYYVIDGVEALQKFGQDAWERVICVLTTGQAWQFKPYKWQDPKILFRNGKKAFEPRGSGDCAQAYNQ
ncbi:MAG: accessory factor associated with RNA polymerase II [Tremellales sp. Tagirdzhanova-0007]|nr:MAG: accessory factor associated with RNA polymerase II [Tremellales sp. Tagirdzhanova-0007]